MTMGNERPKSQIENTELELYLKDFLRELKVNILREVEDIPNSVLWEFKGFVDVRKVLNLNKYLDLDDTELKDKVNSFSKTNLFIGIANIEKLLGFNILGITVSTNILNSAQHNLINGFIYSTIRGLTQRTIAELERQITIGILNGESINQIKRRISEILGKAIDNAEMIARTESNRIISKGEFLAAKKSGLNLRKYLSVHLDNKTSAICKELNSKYGNKEQAIAMDQKFTWSVNGGGSIETPPFHPNCFVPETKIITDQGEKSIKDIQIGDYVLTHKNRFKKVSGTMKRQVNEEIFVIETSKGKLKVTENHPIMTNHGWKLVKELKEDDWVMGK